jgi:hypothetical protein
MWLVDFKKERQEEILAAIQSGSPIPAPPSGWTRYEMLQVAGAMYAGLWSHGPVNSDLQTFSSLPFEHREASEETLTQDVHDSIEFSGHLTFHVINSNYDDVFEPHVQVAGARKQVQFVKGRK